MPLAHLLQDLDEETNLHLGGLLQQGVQSGSALGLAQNPKPLFNSTQFILKVLVQGSGCHLLQGSLILVNVGDPLLSELVLGVKLALALTLAVLRLAVEVGAGADLLGLRRAGQGGHVGRSTKLVAGADSPRGRRSQGGGVAGLGGAVAVAHDVGHCELTNQQRRSRVDDGSRDRCSMERRPESERWVRGGIKRVLACRSASGQGRVAWDLKQDWKAVRGIGRRRVSGAMSGP